MVGWCSMGTFNDPLLTFIFLGGLKPPTVYVVQLHILGSFWPGYMQIIGPVVIELSIALVAVWFRLWHDTSAFCNFILSVVGAILVGQSSSLLVTLHFFQHPWSFALVQTQETISVVNPPMLVMVSIPSISGFKLGMAYKDYSPGIKNGVTLWLCQNSYWKWSFIVDLPIENGGSFHSFLYVYQRVPHFWSFVASGSTSPLGGVVASPVRDVPSSRAETTLRKKDDILVPNELW